MSRPSNDSAQQNLATVAGIAQALAVSTSLIYKWVEEGIIPHYRFGKAIRFDVSKIKEWLETKSINPTLVPDSEPQASSSSSNQDRSIYSKPNENLMRDVDRILKSTNIGVDV